MHGFDDYGDQLDKLGEHKVSKGCLYINKLSDVDVKVLGAFKEAVRLIRGA